MTSFDTLRIDQEGAVVRLTLSRPDELNCFDDSLHREFTVALRELSSDAETRAVVLASTGRAFSAGGSFELMMAAHESAQYRTHIVDEARQLLRVLLDMPMAMVAAVQGDALGLGATVVLACDAVVMARKARLGDPHVRIGLVAGDGGCLMWPHAAGMLRAKRHLLTGDPLSAPDAYAMGLVTDLVESPDDVLPAALTLADRIAALPPLAVRGTKLALNAVLKRRAEEVFELALAQEVATLASEDLLEAIRAHKEQRPASFRGA